MRMLLCTFEIARSEKNAVWIDFRVGGGGTVCLCICIYVVLSDYIIHIFTEEMHMGRNVSYECIICHYQIYLGSV